MIDDRCKKKKKVVKVSKQHLNKEYFFSLHIKQYFAASLQIPNLYRVRQKICNQTYFPLGSTRWFSKNSPTLATSIIRSAPPPLHKQTGFLDHSHTRNIRKSMWISAFGGSDLATTFCKQTISLRPSAVQPGFTSWANNSGTSDKDMHGIGPTRYIQPFRCVASWVMWCRSDVVEAREATVASNAMVGAESLEWTWGHCFQSVFISSSSVHPFLCLNVHTGFRTISSSIWNFTFVILRNKRSYVINRFLLCYLVQ